ncbi:TatD DNase family protein [Bacteroidales bacterium WCE2008]|nr:TatD DNase family protein [Bacteroidales bacterium WCE2008]
MARYIDTHAHFYDEGLVKDSEEAIGRAIQAGVTKMIQADIDSKERDLMWEIADRHPGAIFNMTGLYPGSVGKDWEHELEAMMPYFGRGSVAVGEIGLDYHWSVEFAAEQKLALKAQLELADRMDMPVNIHLRDATDDFFAVLEECRGLRMRGNVHAFSGSWETFVKLQKYGDWSVGIGGVVTYKNAKVAESVKKIPLEKILLETDAPYLPPVPHRGERNESCYIPLIAAKIAELKGIDIEEVAAVTTANAESLFRI